jgi:DNA adenine methylase
VNYSPLRYPGGKQVLSRVLTRIIELNGATGGTYIEPYAGGAGAALTLLYDERVDRIVINDADYRIYAFWRAALGQTDEFVERIRTVKLNVAEWQRQRNIYQRGRRESILRLGFATFYLNRCNRSGIIASGGPIGGLDQRGIWKIDARFNRPELAARIRRLAAYSDRIEVTNLDAVACLRTRVMPLPRSARPFAYLDPPYFAKAEDLYMNHYAAGDHATVAEFVQDALDDVPWVMTYDDVPEIRRLYCRLRAVPLVLDYSARDRRQGREMLILKTHLTFPAAWRAGIPLSAILQPRTIQDRLQRKRVERTRHSSHRR